MSNYLVAVWKSAVWIHPGSCAAGHYCVGTTHHSPWKMACIQELLIEWRMGGINEKGRPILVTASNTSGFLYASKYHAKSFPNTASSPQSHPFIVPFYRKQTFWGKVACLHAIPYVRYIHYGTNHQFTSGACISCWKHFIIIKKKGFPITSRILLWWVWQMVFLNLMSLLFHISRNTNTLSFITRGPKCLDLPQKVLVYLCASVIIGSSPFQKCLL